MVASALVARPAGESPWDALRAAFESRRGLGCNDEHQRVVTKMIYGTSTLRARAVDKRMNGRRSLHPKSPVVCEPQATRLKAISSFGPRHRGHRADLPVTGRGGMGCTGWHSRHRCPVRHSNRRGARHSLTLRASEVPAVRREAELLLVCLEERPQCRRYRHRPGIPAGPASSGP